MCGSSVRSGFDSGGKNKTGLHSAINQHDKQSRSEQVGGVINSVLLVAPLNN